MQENKPNTGAMPYLLGGELAMREGCFEPDNFAAGVEGEKFYSTDILVDSPMSGYTYRFLFHTEEASHIWFLLPRPHISRLWINEIEVLPSDRARITSADAFCLADYGKAPYVFVQQVSASSVYKGYQGIAFGTYAQITQTQDRWLKLDVFALGLCAMLILFCLTLYFYKKSELYLLLMAFFTMVNMTHFLMVPRHPSMIFPFAEALPYLKLLFCLHYFVLKQFIPQVMPKHMDYVVIGLTVFGAFIRLAFPQYFPTALYIILSFLWAIQYYFIARAALHGVWGASILMVGISATLANEIFFLLISARLLPHGALDVLIMPAQYAIMAYVGAFAILTCMKFANKYSEADLLSNELEQRVQTQTNELRRANENMAAIQQRYKQLMAGLVHNFRNPLFALGGYLDLLDGEMLHSTPEQARYLELMNDKIMYMEKMFRDLLLAARLEAGLASFHVTEFRLDELISAVKDDAISRLKNKCLDIQIQCGDIGIWADQFAIRQVLDNIIDNAIRFSPDNGKIIVSACVETESVSISVLDEGPGINEELLPDLFAKYKTTGLGGSTGLGLSIAKALLEKQQGEIFAENITPHGAKFTFIIPRYVKLAEEE